MDNQTTQTWYVAGLARYVLVDATSEEVARSMGEAKLGRPARAVRLADQDEIELAEFDRQNREDA